MRKNNIPNEIIVYYASNDGTREPHYSLLVEDLYFANMTPLSIYEFFDNCQDESIIDEAEITYWVPSQHGWDVDWQASGREFLGVCILEHK